MMATPAPAALQARVNKLLGSRAELEATKALLQTTKRETQQVQTEAAALASKRDKVQEEWKEAKDFLGRYQLTEDEVRALYAENLPEEAMDDFFNTLERVQQVKTDCKELVASDEVNCALELLDAVGKYQEVGFERLYQWTARKCAEVDGEPSNMLHRAIALLSDRAEFYNYCKESLTTSRRSLIVRRFIMALTAIATESEFFRVLFDGDVEFSPSAGSDPSLTEESATGSSSSEEICTSMVGRAFDGVARPLQVRVEQTLSSPHGIVIAYKLVHLLAFYHHKFDELVAHAAVARALRHCREAANEAFHRQFQQLVDAVAASAQDYAASLAATHVTLDVSHRLVALLEVFQTSLLPEQEKEADLAPLFDGILPALELMCQRSVTGLDPVDALVFRLNNFSCLQAPLVRFPEVAKWHTAMTQDLDRWLRDLSELQATQQIQQFQQTHALQPDSSPADTAGLDGETITRVMGDFCAALMTLMFPQFDSLAQPALSDKARALTCATLAGTYAFIYEFVLDARNGYICGSEAVSSSTNRCVVLQHTPEEIRTVLEIDDTK
eukprot:jgi/Phyca11/17830/fgenesh1_pg.PHYCAscaffold_31_\